MLCTFDREDHATAALDMFADKTRMFQVNIQFQVKVHFKLSQFISTELFCGDDSETKSLNTPTLESEVESFAKNT